MILTKCEAVEEQDQAGRQGPGHGVHQDIGHDVDSGHHQGQVDGCPAHQRNLAIRMVTEICLHISCPELILAGLFPAGSLPCLKYPEVKRFVA